MLSVVPGATYALFTALFQQQDWGGQRCVLPSSLLPTFEDPRVYCHNPLESVELLRILLEVLLSPIWPKALPTDGKGLL